MDSKARLIDIGNRIREIRQAKNMSQADLAFAAHISPPNVSEIEHGKSNMWLLTFIKILDALQVSSDTILRPDAPEVSVIYKKEMSELLDDCSPAEMEAILQILKQVKKTLHEQNKDEDF